MQPKKGAFIGEFTNLTDSSHTLTLQVDPDSPEGRKKISLDSFDIIKAPAVGLDSPSIALKENEQNHFLKPTIWRLGSHRSDLPGVKDPLVLRKVDKTHLVTSGDQTILSVQDNQVQIPIPEETNRKAGNAIEAYSIQGNTTSSPIVAVFTKRMKKKGWRESANYKQGDEPAPTVEKLNTLGLSGLQGKCRLLLKFSEYTRTYRTAGARGSYC